MSPLFDGLLLLAVFGMALLTCYFWWKKDQHTRERFVFSGFLALMGFALFYLQSMLGNASIIDRLLMSSTPSPLTPTEAVLTGLVLFGVSYQYLQIFKRWNGLKSIAQYAQEQKNIKPSIWRDIKALVTPNLRKQRAPYQADTLDDESLQTPASLTWHERARQLWLLRHRSYLFDQEYDDARQCWLGEEKNTGALALLLCVPAAPAHDALHALAAYARTVVDNRQYSEIELIVVLKNATLDLREETQTDYTVKYTSEGLLLENLVDFSDYFADIRHRVEREKLLDSDLTLADTYTPPSYRLEQDSEPQDVSLEAYIRRWLQDPTQPQLAVLGEYGQGKSTVSLMLSYHLQAHIETASPPLRIPILIELRGKSLRSLSPEELLATWAYRYRIDTQALLHLHWAGRLLLIFDGFDEIDLSGDAQTRIRHFHTLWRLNDDQARIMITGRPNFFLDNIELKNALGSDEQTRLIYLTSFNLAQIRTALRAENTQTQTEIFDLAAQNGAFLNIISRPSSLYWVASLWDKHTLSPKMNSAQMVDLLIRQTLRQQQSKQDDSHTFMLLNSAERHYFMVGVAVTMAAKGLHNQINKQALAEAVELLVDAIPEAVSKSVSAVGGEDPRPLRSETRFDWRNRHAEMLKIATDVRSCGLLVADVSADGGFKFAHALFQEVLQAQVAMQLSVLDEAKKHNRHSIIQPIHRLDLAGTSLSALAGQLPARLRKRTLKDPVVAKALWLPQSSAVLPTRWDQQPMTLTRLSVRNYRGFQKAEWAFASQFTLLIGDNGTGKTAILKALAMMMRTLFVAFRSDVDARFGILQSDVRQNAYRESGQIALEAQYPIVFEMHARIGEQTLTWNLTQQTPSDIPAQSGYQFMVDLSQALQQAVQYGESVNLPIIAFYPCGRLWHSPGAIDTVPPASRFAGYDDCLPVSTDEHRLFAWWKTQTLSAMQKQQPSQLLHIVKQAVCACLMDWVDIDYQVQMDALMVTHEDGRVLPFHMLSDGVRNMLVLVADIAHRAAILNPHLGDAVLQQTSGLVLIDEIDLHLHPKWQRRMIDDLRRVFPKVQFIATTHSPFMIQSLQPGELVDLNVLGQEPYSDRSIEDITEAVMGVEMPQKSQRYQQMMAVAQRYYALLEEADDAAEEDLERLKEQLDELLIPYNKNPAFTAYLVLQRAKKLRENDDATG